MINQHKSDSGKYHNVYIPIWGKSNTECCTEPTVSSFVPAGCLLLQLQQCPPLHRLGELNQRIKWPRIVSSSGTLNWMGIGGVKTVIQDTGTRRIYLRHLYRPPLYCSSEDMITAIQGSFLSSRYTSQYTWSGWPTRKMIERRILTLCMNAGSYIVCYHWRRSHNHGDPGLTLSGQDQPSLYHF